LLRKTITKWYNANAKNCTLVVQRWCEKFVKSGTLEVRNHTNFKKIVKKIKSDISMAKNGKFEPAVV